MNSLTNLKERFKAWRRGERKISGAPMRGRCFEKKDSSNQEPSGGVMSTKAAPSMKITKMTIVRADGSIEEVK